MKQHQMTHKFRDSEQDSSRPQVSTTPDSKSSPFTSPGSSDHSPPFSVSAGVKRPGEDGGVGVSLVDRPPEKRAILCGQMSSGELTLTTPITTSSQQYFVQHKTRRNVTTCLSAEEKNCFPFESDRFLSSFYFIHLEKCSRRARQDFDLLRHFSNLI